MFDMKFVEMLGGLEAEITVGTGTGSPLWFACRAASLGYAGRGVNENTELLLLLLLARFIQIYTELTLALDRR
jgi:hypothetical protein